MFQTTAIDEGRMAPKTTQPRESAARSDPAAPPDLEQHHRPQASKPAYQPERRMARAFETSPTASERAVSDRNRSQRVTRESLSIRVDESVTASRPGAILATITAGMDTTTASGGRVVV